MQTVEASFPILGRSLPEDNGYAIYAALSAALGEHLPQDVAVASVGGRRRPGSAIALDRGSHLCVRLPADRIAVVLPLAGRYLDVEGHEIGLGIPSVRVLEPAETLQSRLVTIKGYTEPGPFLGAVAVQLDSLGVRGTASIPPVPGGPHAGRPQRRVLRIKGRKIVGYALRVEGLSAPDAGLLLARGLGGRRHMGCGIFSPVRDRGEAADAG